VALDRRSFLKGAAGSLALASPWLHACATPLARLAGGPADLPFAHGVASGDPLADRVILWTRVTPEAPGPVEVAFRLARDPGLRDVVARGSTTTGAARDFTVKIDALGLEPGATYYYRFDALGASSPVGRTRTLPPASPERARLAFCSCANIGFGYFNAYALLAERNDLDAVLHLGDYIYEYANRTYGDGTPFGRVPEPDAELVSLVDYRTRHAQYKRDRDLQELHRQHPVIAVWDDHEIANNAWRGGAQNHQPEREGEWAARRRAAVRAWHEWLPVREQPADATGRIYRSFRFGDLLDLLMLDTRLVGRQEPVYDLEENVAAWAAPGRTLLGRPQEAWLLDRLSASARRGAAWRVLGQQVVFAPLRRGSGRIANPDAWDGYPAARARILDHLAREGIDDVVVLTGDVHSSWALDVAIDPYDPDRYDPETGRGARAVEFVTPAVTSPSFAAPEDAEGIEREAREQNPHLGWLDVKHRGYALLDVDRREARCEWWHVDTVTERSRAQRFAAGFRTPRGRSHLTAVAGPAEPPRGGPPPAPGSPQSS